MNRRIIYKEEAKCNFCYNWFQVFSEIKFGLNICQTCIYKALNTSCFKFPTPDGNLYQVYLARRSVSINPVSQSALLQGIDEYMHIQIRQILDKWEEITKIVKSCNFTQIDKEQSKNIQSIIKNDAQSITLINSKTMQKIKEDITMFKQKKQRKNICTPMKQKSINLELKCTNKSNKKFLNRNDSKISVKTFREQNETSKNKDQLDFLDENNQSQSKGKNCSPFLMSQIKRNASTKVLENRQFITKMQQIKNNICLSLQERQLNLPEPINILKQRIYEAIQNTNCINKCIELVSYSGLQNIDIKCYLSNLDWDGVQVVKFVKVGLNDEQLEVVLNFIKQKAVQTLVLTSNNLTEESCQNLLRIEVQSLKNIYLGKNQILSLKAKNQIKELKSKYNFFL